MPEVGQYSNLVAIRETDSGMYLDAGELGEILLPGRYFPPRFSPGDDLEVFIYRDSEDRLVATTLEPYAKAGDFALLNCKATTKFGAFLDWGLPKDLLVPFREQKEDMQEGEAYFVYVYLDDETGRLAASSKVDKFLDNIPPEYQENEEVNLIIYAKTDLGYKAVINNTHVGLLFHSDVLGKKPIRGKTIRGYILKVREDGKIDVRLQKSGFANMDSFSKTIMEILAQNEGFLAIGDKSSPDAIFSTFGMSKKNFKKAAGSLYKKRLILIEKGAIKMV